MSKYDYHIDKALNFPGAGKLIADKGISALNEELRRRGEQAKDNSATAEEETAETPTQDAAKDYTPLLDETLAGLGEHQKVLDDLETAQKTQADAFTKELTALKDKNAALEKDVAALHAAVKAMKADTPRRASESSETKLGDDEAEAAKKAIDERNQQYDPAFPGMNVPMKTP